MMENISKSARKRIFKEEEEACQELALLTDRDLQLLPASREVKDEILACRKLKGSSRKRQIKYLAKKVREGDVAEIFDFLAARKGSQLKENKLQHEAERLRDQLVDEAIAHYEYCQQYGETFDANWPGEVLDTVVEQYQLDEVDLRRTLFQFARTRVQNYYREVFRILKAAIEKDERQKKRQSA
jgi:ribosome-associated protein